MNLRLLYSIFLLLLLTLSSCSRKGPADGNYRLEIYATNDLHGRYFNSMYIDNQHHPHSLASVSSFISQQRQESGRENILLLDIGDHLQGDNAAFYYNFVDTTSVHIFASAVNYLEYDAIVVGNHDVEAGHPVYNKLVKELHMPYLAANAIDMSSGKPYFEPYAIIERNGIRIAVIGMTNPNIPNWLSSHLWEGMEFREISESLSYWVEYVRENEAPHIVVAALHAGLGDQENDSKENPARYVASNIPGIDIVFASHDHKITAEKISNGKKEVLLLEGGSRASHLSAAFVDFVVENGIISSIKIEGETIPMEGVDPDIEYLDMFKNEYEAIKNFTNKPVGMLLNDISTIDAYFGPSAFIDMIHTLQLEVSGADISFAAPLSFNVSKKAGQLNFHDLLDIYPYENQLYVITMTGAEVKNYLEYSYSKWVEQYPSASGYMLQINPGGKGDRARFRNIYFNFDSAAGIFYEVDITKGDHERITIKSLANGAPFNLSATYKVAMSSYRASGGGELLLKGAGVPKELMDQRLVTRHADIRQLLYNKIVERGSIEAIPLNHWKFTPENLVGKLAPKDKATLFIPRIN